MIWLAWRQLRAQAAVVYTALAALAVLLFVTGLHLRHGYDTSGISSCGTRDYCDTLTRTFTARYDWLQTILGSVLILCLPAVTGAFWGAPLIAREFDAGTYRLAWTQSVTRTRWLAAKVAVVGAASTIASGLLSWLTTWWFTPLDKFQNKFDASVFSERDIAPIGYAAFAFALGLAAGLLIRRTLAAMAVTLIGYVAARVVVLLWVRPRFAAPQRVISTMPSPPAAGRPVGAIPPGPGGELQLRTFAPAHSWVLSTHLTDPSGRSVSELRLHSDDPCVATRSCFAGYHQIVTYHAADRYWPFQWTETALFCAMAALLIGFCFWWINGHPLPRRFRRTTVNDAPPGPYSRRSSRSQESRSQPVKRVGVQPRSSTSNAKYSLLFMVQMMSAISSRLRSSRSAPVVARSSVSSRMLRARRSLISRHSRASSGLALAASRRTRKSGASRCWITAMASA